MGSPSAIEDNDDELCIETSGWIGSSDDVVKATFEAPRASTSRFNIDTLASVMTSLSTAADTWGSNCGLGLARGEKQQ
jgi:hypothetical protein